MSDGPYKSLPMTKAWKNLAQRAENETYSVDDVRDFLPLALQQDWEEIPKELWRKVASILGDNQRALFDDRRVAKLENLAQEAAGHQLASRLLHSAIRQAAGDRSGTEALLDAAEDALRDRAARRARQVEEHYLREASDGRATSVRRRLDGAIGTADMRMLAAHLTGLGKGDRLRAPTKKSGLDEGVEL